VLGVIGRNGSGKSTLLKILARITDPSEGWARIRGRVGSLLEVGTGFHPDLTGRENVFLNGAVLGMRRDEVRRKFDEIVAFAGVEAFLDTPVKRYSSGMQMRLAFAVAAHLDPEILLVDEVLAVGDAAFQKRCHGRIQEVAREGRTILFVSHAMDSVRRLCDRVVWLHEGRVRMIGDAAHCVQTYLYGQIDGSGERRFEPALRFPGGIPIRVERVSVSDPARGVPTLRFSCASPIRIEIEWTSEVPLTKPRIGIVLRAGDGHEIVTSLDTTSWAVGELAAGRRVSSTTLPGKLLNEGEYLLEIGADCLRPAHGFRPNRTEPLVELIVEDDNTLPGKYYGEEGFRDARWPGDLLLHLAWEQRDIEPRS
ncbi:MAG: polysaccharide ABC transporter ATP-binding protein, partial [bacterium]